MSGSNAKHLQHRSQCGGSRRNLVLTKELADLPSVVSLERLEGAGQWRAYAADREGIKEILRWLHDREVLLAVALSSYGYGCVLAALALRWRGMHWLVLNLGYMSIMAFCGVNVPTTFWLPPIRLIANILPVTHGLLAIRDLLVGAGSATVLPLVGFEVAVGLGWFAVATLLVDRLVSAGRRDGSLEFAH